MSPWGGVGPQPGGGAAPAFPPDLLFGRNTELLSPLRRRRPVAPSFPRLQQGAWGPPEGVGWGRGAQGRRRAGSASGGADAQRLWGGTWPGLWPSAHLGRSPEAAAGGGRPRAGGGPAYSGLAGEPPSTAPARAPSPAGAGLPRPSPPAFVSRVSPSSFGNRRRKAPSP